MEQPHALALENLLDLEWDNPTWPDACPVCEQTKTAGHRADCRLNAAIAALTPARGLTAYRRALERDLLSDMAVR